MYKMENLQKKANQKIFFVKVDLADLVQLRELLHSQNTLKHLLNNINFKIAKNLYYKEKYQDRMKELLNESNISF